MPFFGDRTDRGKDVDGEMADASESSFEIRMTFSEEAECDNNLSENLCSASGETQQLKIVCSWKFVAVCHKRRY